MVYDRHVARLSAAGAGTYSEPRARDKSVSWTLPGPPIVHSRNVHRRCGVKGDGSGPNCALLVPILHVGGRTHDSSRSRQLTGALAPYPIFRVSRD